MPALRNVSSPHGGHFVRRAVMRHAFFAKPVGGRLQHDSHGRRHGSELGELIGAQVAGIEVRQKARFLEDGSRGRQKILCRRGEAHSRPMPHARPL